MYRQLRGKGGYEVSQEQLDVAYLAMQINLIKAAARLEPRMEREVRSLVA